MTPAPYLLDPRRCKWRLEDVHAASSCGAARRKLLHQAFGLEGGPAVQDAGLYDLSQGVAIIRVYGPLFDDDIVWPNLGLSGYGGLAVQLEAAMADPAVKAVMFDIDSPGGVAAPALAELADQIKAAGALKPVVANVKGFAASAAYWLASAAGAVVVPDLGEVGSIGVWTMHIDMSARLEEMGFKVSLIFAGAHKVDGNPFEALSEAARAELQAGVDETHGLFAAAVARYRGLSIEAVLATEARMFRDRGALAAGLADAVMPRKETLQELIDSVA